MKYLMLFLLLIVSPRIWAQHEVDVMDFKPQATITRMMSWGFAVEHEGELIDAITMLQATEHNIAIGYIRLEDHKEISVFHGGVRFVGIDKSTGTELYLHESVGLVIGFLINWKNKTLQIEYEGAEEPYFFVDDVCQECTEEIPPAPIEIPENHTPNKIKFRNLNRL